MAEGSVSIAELSLSCHGLRNKDWLSKSDPFVVIFAQPKVSNDTEAISELMKFQQSHLPAPSEHAPERITCAQGGVEAIWHFVCETEVVWNELSPYFVCKFRVPWVLVSRLRVRFEIYDMDIHDAPLAKQDFLGAYQADCGDLALARNTIHALSDKKGRTRERMGTIRIIVDRYDFVPILLATKLTLRVQIAAGAGIDAGTQMFFVLLRSAPLTAPTHKKSGGNAGPKAVMEDEEGAGWVRLHRSGAQASPATKREWTYQDVQLREDVLTAGDESRFLRLELFLHKANGRHQRVGGTRSFTLGMMRECQLNARQRLVPDVASGASLRSAEYAVDSAHCSNGSPDRQNSASILHAMRPKASGEVFRPFMSNNRCNVRLTESEFVFRFSNFVWWPSAKKDGLPAVFRTLSGRKAAH